MKTPGGGISNKKTKQQRREALFKKKRAKSALSRKVQSIDMGLYPVDTDSSDEDLFTGNVWWEVAGQLEGEGVDNAAFEPDSRVQHISAPVTSQPQPALLSHPALQTSQTRKQVRYKHQEEEEEILLLKYF